MKKKKTRQGIKPNDVNDIYKDAQKVYFKVDTMWYCIELYLLMLEKFGAYEDEEFARRLDDLLRYVRGKMGIPIKYDVVADYVVYELAVLPDSNGGS